MSDDLPVNADPSNPIDDASDVGQYTTSTSAADSGETWLRAAARLSSAPRAVVSAPLPIGTQLCGGRFVIGKMLGRGGMGAVYEVHDIERDAHLALKTLLDGRSETLLAFKNEFRALQDLTHPNLVRLDEFFEDDGRWFFTMERIEGVPFTRFVRPQGLDPERLRQSLAQLAQGLRALHGEGKIHRDVKPSNTLIERAGRVVLLDFGLIGSTRSTANGVFHGAGTAAYMAPEQASGDDAPAADWYGVGVMLYEALTGELPFVGRPQAVLARKRIESPRPPSAFIAGVPPELERLCLDLLQRDPERRPDGKEVLVRLGGGRQREPSAWGEAIDERPATHFVGRARELGQLHQVLADIAVEGPITLMLRGESGVGKSSLLDAFIAGLKAPAKVLAGRCYEREFVPFKALDGVIDALARQLDEMDDAALVRLLPPLSPTLARIFPVLGRACRRAGLDTEEFHPANPIETRRRAFMTLQDLLSNLAREGPLVLAIDDLHWADAESLSVIEGLLHGPGAPAILLILVARSGTTPPASPREIVVIELEALLEEDARELARALMDARPETPHCPSEWLAKEAGRHPLFMETMMRHVRAGERAKTVTLEDALGSQVAALPTHARELIEVVSIASQPLSPSLVAQATGLQPEPLLRLLRALQTEHLVLSVRRGPEPSIEPYHDQIRRAVTGCMSQERQLSCHRRIAEALESLAPDRLEALAIHWQAAGEPMQARKSAILAGHHARQALAFDRAAAFYGLALEVESGPSAEAAGLRRWYADALASAGRGAESAAAYRAAAEHAQGHERTDLARCAAEQLLRSGHTEEGLAVMDGVLASVGMARARSVPAAARILLQEQVLETCGAVARRILPLGTARAGRLARKADACWTAALGLSQFDPVASAVFQARHLRLARRLGDPVRIALGLCMNAPAGAFAGPPAKRARRTLAEADAVMHGRADPRVAGYQALAAGAVAFMLGNWTEALAQSEAATTLFRENCVGVAWEMATAQRFVLDCLWHTGRMQLLAEQTWAAWREASARGDRYAVVQIETTVLPVVHLRNDDLAAASAVLRGALVEWPHRGLSLQRWQHTQTRTLVELYAGRSVEALELMESQVAGTEQALLRRIQAVRVFSRFLYATTLLGVAARRSADSTSLVRRAERDARRIEKERTSPETVAILRGQIELLRGDRAGAAERFALAETLFTARGLRLLAVIANLARGVASGGPDGRARIAESRSWMLAEGIRCPEGFVRLFAPAVTPPDAA